jgi:hypothetical protein
MAVLLKDGDQELDYSQKFLCTVYSMTNGLVEEQMDILDVLATTSYDFLSISTVVYNSRLFFAFIGTIASNMDSLQPLDKQQLDFCIRVPFSLMLRC